MEAVVIYADILFIINFIADGICLGMTGLILGKAFIVPRFVFGCALGGLYSLAALPLGTAHPVASLTLHGAAALIICLTAFPYRGFRSVAACAFCFFICCALLGGTLWSIYSLCGAFALYNGAFYCELSPTALVATVVAAGLLLLFCVLKAKGRLRARHGDVRICYRGKCCTLFCLADSGNLLCCPFTGLPVVIAGEKALSALFDGAERERLKATPAGDGIRPISVRGIGGEALLPSFVPERSEVRLFGKREYREKRLCIALDFEGKSFGGCDGIAPANIF